jgi:hypothetical protein
MPLTLDDLMQMDRHQLHAIVSKAHPIDPDALDGQQYLGVDLSLPGFMNQILWKTFRKSFLRDPETGAVRGWNTRMEQTGVTGPQVPKTKDGHDWTFAHYELRSAEGLRFPWGWKGQHYLDYGVVGNPFGENLGYTPLVAVNEGDSSLLLGWEIFRIAGCNLPLPDYWALKLDGPIGYVAPRLR